LNPNDADCVVSMGFLLVVRGRPADGLAWIERAMRLNPFHPPWYHVQFATGLYQLGRFSEAAQALRRAPHIGGWSYRLAACYGQLGRAEEAKTEIAAILRADPGFSTGRLVDGAVLMERAEDRERLREGMLKAGLPA
jgi:adenylate cyclase